MDLATTPIDVGDSTSLVDRLAVSARLADARNEISNLRDTVAGLKRQGEKQAVLLRAMFALLSERIGLTEAELLARFQLLESAKGANPPAIVCTQCGRLINLRHNRCLHCGAVRQVESAFELL